MNIDMIQAAQFRLASKARRTPLLSSPFLDDLTGRRILIKPECLQHTGSFKFRGAWSAISALDRGVRAKGIIAFSSGNHAQGVAHAARMHGTKSVIVMPSDAPQLKIDNTRALGAEIVLYNRATEDRDAIGDQLSRERDLVLIKPFDNEQVIAGQGTVGLEIAEQSAELGADTATVLVPCGGGGLTAGIALALAAKAPAMQVHPVEPEGFDDVARSLKSGQLETCTRTTGSVCDAILTPSAGAITFPIMKNNCGAGQIVSDDDCLRAMAQAYNRLKLVVEPGGAAALAAALYHHDKLQNDTLIVVLSGGNVDASVFKSALDKYG